MILEALPKWARPSGPVLVLQARQSFPSAAKVTLIWGRGIRTASGVATERDQTLEFKTRPAFTAEVSCERLNARSDCIPLTPIRLAFSAPVAWDEAKLVTLVGADGVERRPDSPDSPEPFVYEVEFRGPFAEKARFELRLPAGLHDDAGRIPINRDDFPQTLATDSFPPLAKFAARFGIVEWEADPVLPVTLRNLEPEIRGQKSRVTEERQVGYGADLRQLLRRITGTAVRISPAELERILPWLQRLAVAKRDKSIFAGTDLTAGTVNRFTLPKPGGAEAFEVVGIPFPSPGLYIVELASPRLGEALLGKEQPLYVPAAALVTNLSVHFKWGEANSLVWVTSLDEARPVANARVAVQDCHGRVLATAETDRQGIAHIGQLPDAEAPPELLRREGLRIVRGARLRRLLRQPRPALARLRAVRGRADRFRRQLRALVLERGHRVVALPRAGRRRHAVRRRAHDLRPAALPRRRHRAHEARPARRDAGGLLAGRRGRTPGHAEHPARGQRRDLRPAPAVGRQRAGGEHLGDSARRQARPVRGRAQPRRQEPALVVGIIPRRGVSRPPARGRGAAAGRAADRRARGGSRRRRALSRRRTRRQPARRPALADPAAAVRRARRLRGLSLRQRRSSRRHAAPPRRGGVLTGDAGGSSAHRADARRGRNRTRRDHRPAGRREAARAAGGAGAPRPQRRAADGRLHRAAVARRLAARDPAAVLGGVGEGAHRRRRGAGHRRPTGGRRARFGSTSSSASRTRTASAWSAGSTSTSTSARRARPAPSARDTPTPRGSCAARACRSTPGT